VYGIPARPSRASHAARTSGLALVLWCIVQAVLTKACSPATRCVTEFYFREITAYQRYQLNRLHDGRMKDTAPNIRHNGECVVHMSDEPMEQQMHACGESFPADVSKFERVGFTPTPFRVVRPQRIRESPVTFECVLHEKRETASRYVFIGRIVWMAARSSLIDTEAWRVNQRTTTR